MRKYISCLRRLTIYLIIAAPVVSSCSKTQYFLASSLPSDSFDWATRFLSAVYWCRKSVAVALQKLNKTESVLRWWLTTLANYHHLTSTAVAELHHFGMPQGQFSNRKKSSLKDTCHAGTKSIKFLCNANLDSLNCSISNANMKMYMLPRQKAAQISLMTPKT